MICFLCVFFWNAIYRISLIFAFFVGWFDEIKAVEWYVFKIDRFRIFLEGPFALWCFTGYELKEVNARHPSETAMFLKSYRNCPTKTMILISYFLEVIKKVSCFKAFTKNRQKRCLGEGVFSCCGEGLAHFAEKIMLWSTFCGGTHTERGPQHEFFEKTSRALGQSDI